MSVAVPTKLHHAVAMDTLTACVHMLLEMPIASSTREAAKLVNASLDSNMKLGVSNVNRYDPTVRKVKCRMQAGELGKISSAVARRIHGMPPRIGGALLSNKRFPLILV